MKKATTTGAAPKPAATRVSKPAPAKAAAKPSAVAPASVSAAPAAPASAPAPKKAAARVDRATPKLAETAVVAKIDVGFGNLLYIRGDGPGLSWDRGVPMECASSDTWTWATAAASRPFAYKVLVNDERWSNGDDYVATAGLNNTVWPEV